MHTSFFAANEHHEQSLDALKYTSHEECWEKAIITNIFAPFHAYRTGEGDNLKRFCLRPSCKAGWEKVPDRADEGPCGA